MKRYALLTALCLVFFVTSCSKDALEVDIYRIDVDSLEVLNKSTKDSIDNVEWDRHKSGGNDEEGDE